jgi:hypothetical protein
MANKYIVDLTVDEQEYLLNLIKKGTLLHAKWRGHEYYCSPTKAQATQRSLRLSTWASQLCIAHASVLSRKA